MINKVCSSAAVHFPAELYNLEILVVPYSWIPTTPLKIFQRDQAGIGGLIHYANTGKAFTFLKPAQKGNVPHQPENPGACFHQDEWSGL